MQQLREIVIVYSHAPCASKALFISDHLMGLPATAFKIALHLASARNLLKTWIFQTPLV